MSKSKYAVLALQVFGVILLSGYAVSAQLMPGMIDMRPSMNATMTNSINTARTRAMSGSGSGSSAAADRQRAIGSEKIRTGKANVRFTPTAAGTQEFVKSITWSADSSPTIAGRVEYINELTGKFNKIIVENKLTVNDAVDGMMLAYAIAATVEQGKRPSPQFLNQKRQKYRNYLLNSPYYQGSSEKVRQIYYENFAMCTMQLLKHTEKFNTAKTAKEKSDAKEGMTRNAKWILGEIQAIDAVM